MGGRMGGLMATGGERGGGDRDWWRGSIDGLHSPCG